MPTSEAPLRQTDVPRTRGWQKKGDGNVQAGLLLDFYSNSLFDFFWRNTTRECLSLSMWVFEHCSSQTVLCPLSQQPCIPIAPVLSETELRGTAGGTHTRTETERGANTKSVTSSLIPRDQRRDYRSRSPSPDYKRRKVEPAPSRGPDTRAQEEINRELEYKEEVVHFALPALGNGQRASLSSSPLVPFEKCQLSCSGTH